MKEKSGLIYIGGCYIHHTYKNYCFYSSNGESTVHIVIVNQQLILHTHVIEGKINI